MAQSTAMPAARRVVPAPRPFVVANAACPRCGGKVYFAHGWRKPACPVCSGRPTTRPAA